jgi:hypothetical protein
VRKKSFLSTLGTSSTTVAVLGNLGLTLLREKKPLKLSLLINFPACETISKDIYIPHPSKLPRKPEAVNREPVIRFVSSLVHQLDHADNRGKGMNGG